MYKQNKAKTFNFSIIEIEEKQIFSPLLENEYKVPFLRAGHKINGKWTVLYTAPMMYYCYKYIYF